ncbi:MAG: hypothetical protein PHH96_04310 [Smithellaceae bacterium]|jgi:hypothetical protein|nr:hypothetical protein [Smithellaceae bacterium]HBL53084.1 hypothetical protein [Syntrophaceae bacterium]
MAVTESGEKTKREALVENRQKEGLEVSRREMLILSSGMACNIAYRIEKAASPLGVRLFS